MSKAGCPYDNAPMERFYNTFKSNFYNVTSFSNVEMMDELTTKYIIGTTMFALIHTIII